MTVAAGYVPNSYAATGVAATYAYQFRIIDQTHLLVQLNGVNLTLTTDYTVDGVGQPGGGNITPVTPAAIVGTLVISSNVPYSRTPDFQDDFRAKTFNDDQDLQTMQNRQLAEAVLRAITAPIGSTFVGTLPALAGNGLKNLRLNAAANAIEYVDPGSVALAIPADGSVTPAKLAAGTQGDILYAGAAGAWAKLAAGTAGQVLKTGGAGANPSWGASASGFIGMKNGTIVTSRAGNAETIAIKTLAGADPSAADPVTFYFRDTAAGTGGIVELNAIAALSITIPSTATLGAANTVPFKIWLTIFNDATVLRLGVVKTVSGTSVMALKDDDLNTSTLTPANSAQVIYTTGAGVASKAMRLLAYLEYTLAVAGTWNAAPTKLQPFGPGVPIPGSIVQEQYNQTGAVATGATTLPFDDTIPQITEGDQFMTQAITPTSSSNVLEITSILSSLSFGGGNTGGACLFQDATANALAAMVLPNPGSTAPPFSSLRHRMLAGTVVSTTFRTRVGTSTAGTTTFNGAASARLYGGVMASSMKVQEIMT